MLGKEDFFPDGTRMDGWFFEQPRFPNGSDEKRYCLTDYGIFDDGAVYTEKIQSLIETIARSGGGVLVVPKGTFLTGALFFKQNVHLLIEKGGVLKGSDDITDYPLCTTRIEGETCLYFPALINGDGLDGFRIWGEGTIDGNGEKSWRAFWLRRKWNPECTNKDEQRPRLVYLSNCTNAVLSGVELKNSHFWTTHFYKCQYVKILDCRFFSPRQPVRAPSTDGVDVDVCSDVLIKNCSFHVNDDAVALKGGKGVSADQKTENGGNERIVVEDCVYEYCHGCLTCGSESIHNKNVILRRVTVRQAQNLLWLKMRPDTPQCYEYIRVEDAKGTVQRFLNAGAWTQFFAPEGRTELPPSCARHVTMRNCEINCEVCFYVHGAAPQYVLSDFCFEKLMITTRETGDIENAVEGLDMREVSVETE